MGYINEICLPPHYDQHVKPNKSRSISPNCPRQVGHAFRAAQAVGKTVKPLNPIHHHPEFLKFRMQRAIPYNTRKPRRDMFWNEALSIYFTLTFIYCHMVNM